ncbi:peptidoglycan-binding protein [Streptomyces anandii]|uniref:Peptidoglycan-binding protein n=1 Tax=Streptomyces anandii TaxID=285454 RepID=A0ABW6HC80_9ACTN
MIKRLMVSGAAALLGVGGLMVPSASAVSEHAPASAAADCTIVWRVSANYHGFTAGYSWAWNAIVRKGDTGDQVREIQCLTQYWGSDPGKVDGVFGQLTEDAVKQQQQHCNIAQDGEVGPDTWRCLRGGGPN